MCRCEERRAYLAERGIPPLNGREYGPADFLRYAVHRITGGRLLYPDADGRMR